MSPAPERRAGGSTPRAPRAPFDPAPRPGAVRAVAPGRPGGIARPEAPRAEAPHAAEAP